MFDINEKTIIALGVVALGAVVIGRQNLAAVGDAVSDGMKVVKNEVDQGALNVTSPNNLANRSAEWIYKNVLGGKKPLDQALFGWLDPWFKPDQAPAPAQGAKVTDEYIDSWRNI